MDTISLFFVTLAGDSRDLCDSVRCHFYATVVDKLQTRERGVGSEIQVRWGMRSWGIRGQQQMNMLRMMEHLNGSDDTWNCFACCSGQRHSSKERGNIFWRHSSRHSCRASVSAFRMRLL